MSEERMLPRPLPRAAVDCAAILVVLLAATLAFGPVFGGTRYLVAGIGGSLLGIAVGVVTSLRPLRGWLMTAAGFVLALVVFGPALAVPRQTIGGVVPTLEGWRELLLGVVFSWKGLLTAEPPAEGFPSLLVVPFLTTLLCGTVATVLALRLERGAPFAMVPPVVALVVGIAFGTKIAFWPTALGAVVAGVVLAWSAWRRATWRTSLGDEVEVTNDSRFRVRARKHRARGAIAMIAAAMAVAALVSIPIQPQSRAVLRDTVEPPIELAEHPSPLAGFRTWHKHFEDETLLTVSGMPAGSRLRLATFDYYDGTVFAVAGSQQVSGSGSFARIGDEVLVQQSGDPATVRVEVGGYSGIWVPDVGYMQSLAFEGPRAADLQGSLHYNGQTGTAIALDGLAQGDAYELQAIVPAQPDHEELDGVPITRVQVPEPAVVPDLLQAWVSEHGASGQSSFENLEAMLQRLQNGSFSHGLEDDTIPSLAGHGAVRIQDMFDQEVLVGDDEQYATAFALALSRINVPARVVMGLYPDDGFPGGAEPVEVTGGDMHAWVEVPFEGLGWVRFDPTPPEDNDQIQPEPEPKPEPKPQVLQPPQPPEEPAEMSPDTVADEGQEEDDEEPADTSWLVWLWVAGGALLVLLLLLLPFLVVGALKAARRKRRRRAARESDRLAGGWHEVVDEAVDLGLAVPAGVTRREVARAVAARYPRSRATDIGEFVDEGVFGPGEPDPAEVDAFWLDVERSVQGMRSEATRRERVLGMLSMRSFARRRQERRRR
ncbi:transglutaminase domain-containing protein [Agrococcus sp. HG114]|uniref:transglutaminase family protein n=1 Tax=Agrococcus sp. HG114 TaxID=2969757 RepID=UPI00215AA0BD|nr:transglutaminase domain-containing protein [Agrococcus sp. HG114]MCR8671865.1 transglutaminaseTgpA domain-containing protein [Agrococcus sp. HG114]